MPSPKKAAGRKNGVRERATRFEAVKIEPLFEVLDAIAWIGSATVSQSAQFAGIDPRTAGKLLKNARMIGLVDSVDGDQFVLRSPYPYKGTVAQKQAVVREALVRLPLIVHVKQFLSLGNDLPAATRKAATVVGVDDFDPPAVAPVLNWAQTLTALDPSIRPETLVQQAVAEKEVRHRRESTSRIAFISHSSKDKPFVRQLAADLVSQGVQVWLDEQRIQVGESIPDKVAQGLAQSDFFVFVLSRNSVQSDWVRRELNGALVREIERRRVAVLPVRLDDAPVPDSIVDKKYADFSVSYKSGLEQLLSAMKEDTDGR